MLEKYSAGGGTVDVLINNAGITGNSTFLMASMKQMRKIFDVNLFGTLLFTQYVARHMVGQKEGQIINIASVRGMEIEEGNILYGMSKASLIYATKVMAKELCHYNISVNAVAPGYIPTDINADKPEALIHNILKKTPLRQHGNVTDVVNAVAFLLDHPSICGQIMRVDGGYTV